MSWRVVHGRYDEFRVLVDGAEVVSAGLLAAVGVLPPVRRVVAAVRDRLPSGDVQLRREAWASNTS